MPADLTVLVPRKDTTDPHWNAIQAYTRLAAGDTPYITGTYDWTGDPHWSMSRAINAARVLATTSKLLITPVDYVVRPDHLEQVSAMLDEWPWWGPFGSVHQLWDEPTKRVMAGEPPSLDMPGDRTVLCMACIAVRADSFDDVAGMDPRFSGYAPEDAALRLKLGILHGWPPGPQGEVVFELWTDRSARPNFNVTGAFYTERYLTSQTPETMRALIAEQSEGL